MRAEQSHRIGPPSCARTAPAASLELERQMDIASGAGLGATPGAAPMALSFGSSRASDPVHWRKMNSVCINKGRRGSARGPTGALRGLAGAALEVAAICSDSSLLEFARADPQALALLRGVGVRHDALEFALPEHALALGVALALASGRAYVRRATARAKPFARAGASRSEENLASPSSASPSNPQGRGWTRGALPRIRAMALAREGGRKQWAPPLSTPTPYHSSAG